jgi:hypothetical protein
MRVLVVIRNDLGVLEIEIRLLVVVVGWSALGMSFFGFAILAWRFGRLIQGNA